MKTNYIDDHFQGLLEVAERFSTDAICRTYLAQKRWKGKTRCPHCTNDDKIYKFRKGNLYKCSLCRKQFTVTVGTIFESSKIPLQKWFIAIYLITSQSKGISSIQLAKHLNITQKSAWFLNHRVRHALSSETFWNISLNGVVEVDETLLGGKEKNKHGDKKIKHSQGRSSKGKIVVVGLVQRNGKVVVRMTKDSTRDSLRPLIYRYVEPGTALMTDEWMGYFGLHKYYDHNKVNHSKGRYVIGEAHTNTIEGFWALLKRGYMGTYHSMSKKHCDRYMKEFEFRYNTMKSTDKARFDLMLNNCNGRLKYAQLTK